MQLVDPHKGTPHEEHVYSQLIRYRTGNQAFYALTFGVERFLATLLHITARGLVYIGVSRGILLPPLVALLCFGGVDGFLYSTMKHQWPFAEPRTAAKMFGIVAVPSTVSSLVLAAYLGGL